jgi:hypothetical protein
MTVRRHGLHWNVCISRKMRFASAAFGAASVPTIQVENELPLFATGIGGLGLLGWRRQRKAQAG